MYNSKLNNLVSTLALAFLFLAAQPAQAFPDGIVKDTTKSNIRITRTNWMNTMGCTFNDTMCVSMWSDNSLVLKLVVQMALEDINDFPPIHFRYIFFNTNPFGTTGTTNEVTNDMIEPVLLENGDEAWQASFVFDFSLAEVCDIKDHFDFRLHYQLVTPGDLGSFIPYPTGFFPTLFPPDTFYIAPTMFSEPHDVIKEICCYDDTYACSDTAVVPYQDYVVNNSILLQDELSRNNEETAENQISLTSLFDNTKMQEIAQKDKARIQVYPNPFSSSIQVHCKSVSGAKQNKLKVYNALGGEIFNHDMGDLNQENNQIRISTEQWPSGIYYFHYFSGKESVVEKIIKQ